MNEFVTYLLEQMHGLGGVIARPMFGGYGMYRDGLMFGLVADDTLYLKTDADTVELFVSRGLPPFSYKRRGKQIALGYYQAPEEALEEAELLCEWSEQAWAVARRAAPGTKRHRLS